MKQFEVGHSYYCCSACDHNAVFTVTIVKRTDKTVVFEQDGQQRRAKLFFDSEGEYIMPERYSMAPVYRAAREVVPDTTADFEEVSEYAAAKELVSFCQSQCVKGMLGISGALSSRQLEFLLLLLQSADGII